MAPGKDGGDEPHPCPQTHHDGVCHWMLDVLLSIKGRRNNLPTEMEMKPLASAFALAMLLAGPAAATHYEISEHVTSRQAHGEVLGGDHAPVKKSK